MAEARNKIYSSVVKVDVKIDVAIDATVWSFNYQDHDSQHIFMSVRCCTLRRQTASQVQPAESEFDSDKIPLISKRVNRAEWDKLRKKTENNQCVLDASIINNCILDCSMQQTL